MRKLRELRTRHGSQIYRVFHFPAGRDVFVLLHGFEKKTEKTPSRELEIAERRMKEYQRMRKGYG